MRIGGHEVALRLDPPPRLLLGRVLLCHATVDGDVQATTLALHLDSLEYDMELADGAALTGPLTLSVGRSRRASLRLRPHDDGKFRTLWGDNEHTVTVSGKYDQTGASHPVLLTLRLAATGVAFEVHRLAGDVCLSRGNVGFERRHSREEHDAAVLPSQAPRQWAARRRHFPGRRPAPY
jgi:hypothetical protein